MYITAQVVDCGSLPTPANGFVLVPAGTNVGDTATYSCNTGYVLTGATTRTCGSNGMWTPVAPTCERTFIHDKQVFTTVTSGGPY